MADLNELAVDGKDRARDAEIDREEHAHRDERNFRRLEDAEPEYEQGHPGDGRNGAQGLKGRVEQLPEGPARSGERAEHDAGQRTDDEADENAPQRHPGMSPQFA